MSCVYENEQLSSIMHVKPKNAFVYTVWKKRFREFEEPEFVSSFVRNPHVKYMSNVQ